MGRLPDLQKKHFSDRIKRIEVGGPNTSGTVYAGLDQQAQPKRRRKKKKLKPLDHSETFSQIFMVPFAIFVGALAMFSGRIGAFHVLQQPELIPPEYAALFPLTGDIAIAALVGLVLGMMFSLGGGARAMAFMLGFTAIMLGEGYLINLAPEAFAEVYSEDYVVQATANLPADPFSPEALGLRL